MMTVHSENEGDTAQNACDECDMCEWKAQEGKRAEMEIDERRWNLQKYDDTH